MKQTLIPLFHILAGQRRARRSPAALPVLLLLLAVLFGLSACKTSRQAEGSSLSACLSSKVRLTVPHKGGALTVNGTLKLVSGQRLQLSFLMPVLRTELVRLDVTPDEVMLVDRMGKQYVQTNRNELKGLLPKKADFAHLEKLLFKAARPGGRTVLEGRDLGIPKLEKGRLELTDFSDKPLSLTPTQVSARYKKVELAELLAMLADLKL